MNKFLFHIKESYNELRNKVTWPSWASLFSSTRLVLIATVIFALVVFIMDGISDTVLSDFIYGIDKTN